MSGAYDVDVSLAQGKGRAVFFNGEMADERCLLERLLKMHPFNHAV
jgi:hypothetical protein